jgi:hypothetical protein
MNPGPRLSVWVYSSASHLLPNRDPLRLRTGCLANIQLGSFGETERAGRNGIIQGAYNCALKVPTNSLKLLI